jgi:serine/threonine protein kinase
MKHLHLNSVIHRDFKLANILRNKHEVKIADLGFAKVMGLKSEAETVLGTKQTMAPEVLHEDLYSTKADIWSLGIVYYQMLFG